jgi:hypothetical protein
MLGLPMPEVGSGRLFGHVKAFGWQVGKKKPDASRRRV